MSNKRRGFTLIELLVVIGILAILTTITVLVLNPAQLFAQARDSQRISDMGTLRGAISLYLTSVSSPDMGVDGPTAAFTCGTNYAASIDGTSSPFKNSPTDVAEKSGTFDIDGVSSWVAVDLSATTGGSPIPVAPRDPTNDTTYFYAYACNNTDRTFEINANMESSRYAEGGDDDVETTDGGDMNGVASGDAAGTAVYEVGTEPGLDL